METKNRSFKTMVAVAFGGLMMGISALALPINGAFADPATAPTAPATAPSAPGTMAAPAKKATKKPMKHKMMKHMKMGKKKPSDFVMKVQKALDAKGAKIKADGYFGPMTRKAIMGFQKTHKLKVTGHVDGATKKALGL
ncbi:MAG: peptidoglycan-binding domain-containing protein [Leptospirales bacterium]